MKGQSCSIQNMIRQFGSKSSIFDYLLQRTAYTDFTVVNNIFSLLSQQLIERGKRFFSFPVAKSR